MLTPMFQANAWIGGPFSNNSYFGAGGEDGVYEASASGINGIGLFRFVVGNEFQGSQTIATGGSTEVVTDIFGNPIGTITTPGINSGNIVFGAFGTAQNIWYHEGVSYLGNCVGTVSNVSKTVNAVGNAAQEGVGVLSSFFKATLVSDGPFLPASAFYGTGEGTPSNTGEIFFFTVFGTKVSNNIYFGL
tara:strand:- start:5477 stop:6043 length:567 start_codon:yes stop_codon:yes gene_type:complete